MARRFLDGGGDMGQRIRAHDWSRHPLGEPESWPTPLKTLVAVLLGSNQAMFLAWGPELTLLYNDRYAEILDRKHPTALGRPFTDVWSEARADLTPLVEAALEGRPTHMDDLALQLDRRGFLEEAHFSFSYTPVRDEAGSVAGFFCACTEITSQIQAQNRREAEVRRQHELFDRAPGFIAVLTGPEHRFAFVNRAYVTLAGPRDYVGRPAREVLPEVEGQGFFELLDQAYGSGERVMANGVAVHFAAGPHRPEATRYIDFVYEPVRDESGQVTGIFVQGQDVTERKAAEAALAEGAKTARATAERLKLALDAGAIAGTWVWEIAADRVVADERFAETFRLDPEACRQGLPLSVVFESIYPDDRQRVEAAIEDALASGVYRCEYRICDAAGDARWVEGRGQVDFDAAGAPVRFPGVLVDTHDRKRAEEALARSTDLLQTFMVAVPGVIYAKDLQGRMLVANRGTAELVGKPLEAIIGRTDAEFLDNPIEAQAVMANDRRVIETGETQQVEERVTLPDGSEAWWHSTKAALRDEAGQVIGLVGASVDITDRRRAEAMLRDTEAALRRLNETLEQRVAERTAELGRAVELLQRESVARERASALYRAYFDNTEESLFVVDVHPDGRFTFGEFNPAHRRATGLERVQGMTPEEALPSPISERVTDNYRRCLSEGGPIHYDEILDLPGGERMWETVLAPVRDETGRIFRIIGSARDVTERRRAEEQMRQLQKIETIGHLTGGVAHDFNNLLTPIVGGLDMLVRRLEQDPRGRRIASSALEAAERARLLVQRLLAFGRRQTLQAEAVDLADLLAGMHELLQRSIGPTSRVTVQAEPGLPAALVDPNQLELALLNLCVNARDAMPNGGEITVTVSADEAAPDLGPGRFLRLSVRDQGIGMTEEVLQRAVEPFFTTKGVGAGTGLGLSMVHGLAAQSSGAFQLESRPGEGTTATLWLPAADRAAAARPDPGATADPALRADRPTRILLVDDDSLVREAVAESLRAVGYVVTEAEAADTALAQVAAGARFEMLVTDYMMPGMTGPVLARAIRELIPDLPVLLITGYAQPSDGPGEFEVLHKPFRQEELARRLNEALAR